MKLTQSLAKKDTEIAEMKSRLEKLELEQKLSVAQAVNSVEKERDDLKFKLQNKEQEIQIREVSLKETCYTTKSIRKIKNIINIAKNYECQIMGFSY